MYRIVDTISGFLVVSTAGIQLWLGLICLPAWSATAFADNTRVAEKISTVRHVPLRVRVLPRFCEKSGGLESLFVQHEYADGKKHYFVSKLQDHTLINGQTVKTAQIVEKETVTTEINRLAESLLTHFNKLYETHQFQFTPVADGAYPFFYKLALKLSELGISPDIISPLKVRSTEGTNFRDITHVTYADLPEEYVLETRSREHDEEGLYSLGIDEIIDRGYTMEIIARLLQAQIEGKKEHIDVSGIVTLVSLLIRMEGMAPDEERFIHVENDVLTPWRAIEFYSYLWALGMGADLEVKHMDQIQNFGRKWDDVHVVIGGDIGGFEDYADLADMNIRRLFLTHKFGLSLSDYNEMLAEWDGEYTAAK